jgi:MFS family permease
LKKQVGLGTSTARIIVLIATFVTLLCDYYNYDAIGPVADLLTRELGISEIQLGSLNAVYSLPNLVLVLVGGFLVDRYTARRVILVTSIIVLVGSATTALANRFELMLLGRFLLGVGSETMIVAVLVALTQWFEGRHLALLIAASISAARFGSFLADRSPSFAPALYAHGWRPPLLFAGALAAVGVLGASTYWYVDLIGARMGAYNAAKKSDRFEVRRLLRLPVEYWLIAGICLAFYAVIFPFRSTFAIEYLQHSRGYTLEEAASINSYVFLAGMFATPFFGSIVDRIGRNSVLLLIGALALPLSFAALMMDASKVSLAMALLGVSFSVVPGVLWPSIPLFASREQLGTAYGLIATLQNLGIVAGNLIAGAIGDARGASAQNAGGYQGMLWFFGVTSSLGVITALALMVRMRCGPAGTWRRIGRNS